MLYNAMKYFNQQAIETSMSSKLIPFSDQKLIRVWDILIQPQSKPRILKEIDSLNAY